MKKLRQQILITLGAFVLLGAWGYWWLVGRNLRPDPNLGTHEYLRRLPDRSLVEIVVGAQTMQVEVVNSPRSITQGLSDRTAVGSDGMLFVLPAKVKTSFWMPRMHFDLDILWFDDEQLLQVDANIPAPAAGTPEYRLPQYPSPQAVNLVLELPAGQASQSALKPGARLEVLRL